MEHGLDPLKILRRRPIVMDGDLPCEMKAAGTAEVVDQTRHGFVVQKVDRVPDARVVVDRGPARESVHIVSSRAQCSRRMPSHKATAAHYQGRGSLLDGRCTVSTSSLIPQLSATAAGGVMETFYRL